MLYWDNWFTGHGLFISFKLLDRLYLKYLSKCPQVMHSEKVLLDQDGQFISHSDHTLLITTPHVKYL
jgi:hypothetical protein